MMKSNIMKRAWEIFRTLVGDYKAKLSTALKRAFNRVGVHYGCFIDFVKFEKASDVAMTDKEKEDYEDSVDDGAAIFTREVKK